jgi:hypothetical protein
MSDKKRTMIKDEDIEKRVYGPIPKDEVICVKCEELIKGKPHYSKELGGLICFECMWSRYREKQKEQEKEVKKMNRILHEGHVRHLILCPNCYDVLGREGIKKNLLWAFEHREKEIKEIIPKEEKEEKKTFTTSREGFI